MTAIEIPTPDPRSLDEATRRFAEAIAERYAIKRLIGRGGMGMVYLARDKRLDRLVAIKTLPPHLATDVAIQERFLRETRTAGAMAHPNIVPIHGADEIDGHVFFVMTYVDGESLAARIRARGTLDATTTARHLRDVAAALAHAHERGIIHRDIKAENILIERSSDRALVTDFGIARLAEASPLTVTGQVLGTVHYVSPEQVSGGHVDTRSDIYSLGVVGFLALAGRFPFDADVASAVLLQHVTKAPAPVATVARGVPASLATIIDRCLAKDPAHRFASATELEAALDAAIPTLGQSSPVAPLISDTEAHQVWHRAAELQALTGMEPRPEITPRERDAQQDHARKQGFALDHVRSAAAEAGISEKYVDRAFAEHGLLKRTPVPRAPEVPTPRAIVERPVERDSWWAGAPPFIA
ncbi:MAG: protein kinase domain-containing protein, partial [Gemmatimonadaceae bacterium]